MNLRLRPAHTALALPEQHAGTIRQSHERCTELGLSRIERPDHAPLGRPDLLQVRDRHHRLHAHAAPVMEMLFGQIQGTQSMVVLCDSAGTIIHSIGDDDFLSRASKVALQPGVNWSEQAKGTNAIGTALIEEQPTLVHADEHYMHANHFLTCSAAPIVDPRGNVLGVLDVTGDHRSYHPHTMALVKLSARMIENHWLRDDHRHALRVHFHHRADFIGTLMEGILAVSPEGRVVGANRGALELLGLPGVALRRLDVQALFGLSVAALVDHFRAPRAAPLAAGGPQGRVFQVLARFSGPGWGGGARAVAGRGDLPAGSSADVAAAGRAAPPMSALQALLTGDAQMAALVDKLRRVLLQAVPVEQSVPVVLVGETGSGKNLLARALHQDSPRAGGPLVVLGCAAADAQALQDAVQQAQGGTLVLDGVAELPPALQALLLHLLQQPGCALVSTSPLPLQAGPGPQQLRDELFHRLQGLGVRLPPLRERCDLAVLARHALDALQATDRAEPQRLSEDALALLLAHDWPGNVRQLHTVLRTAALLAGPQDTIEVEHLPDELRAPAAAPAAAGGPDHRAAASLGQIEQQAMEQALQAARGNVSAAARQLGVSRNTLYRRLRWGAAAKA
jgi:sigma-54 dependent transcriptional regulator, acetoin dehydrogenase operon transcriptional activator AcoR